MTLKSEDFLNPLNRGIFDAIIKLDAEKKDIDAITIQETIPGVDVAYVRGLADLMPTWAHIDTYIEQVRSASRKKRLIEGFEKILADAKESQDIEKMLGEIQNFGNENIEQDINDCMSIKDLMIAIYPEIRDGRETGLQTGFDTLDRGLHGFYPQNLIVLASGAGKGKTAIALNFCVNMIQDNKHILFYSLEMSKFEIGKRMLAIDSEISSNKSDKILNGNAFSEGKADYRRQRQGALSALSFEVNDRVQSLNTLIADARARATEQKRRGNPYDLIVVDYLQLIMPNNVKDNRERQVAESAYGLKMLAKILNIPVLAIAQVNRLADKEKGREYETFDLRESGAIEQAADIVIFLNHARKALGENKYEEKYNLSIKKVRHGSQFFVPIIFTGDITKFREVENDKTC
jgi:replicative DNA helicase